MLLLSRHVTEKDKSLKTQLLKLTPVVEKTNLLESLHGQNGFFGEEKSVFGINKVKYLKNPLFYLIQAYLTVQKGENIIHAEHVILGQIIAAANSPYEIETYRNAENEVKLAGTLYKKPTGEFLGL